LTTNRFLRVRNFEKYQHYSTKNLKQDLHPTWIKLYYALMADRMFYRLPDAYKFHVVGFFLIASQYDNKIPADLDWLQYQMAATEKVNLKAMLESRFIEWVEPDGPRTPALPEIIEAVKNTVSDITPLEVPKYQIGAQQIREEEKREENKKHTRTPSEGPVIPKDAFDRLWAKYPAKDGRKQAARHFSASVKTEQDLSDCVTALEHYLAHLKLPGNDWKRPKNGDTWFNNWRDWVEWTEPQVAVEDAESVEQVRRIFRKKLPL
jgi:hypothetical protein